MKKALFTTLTAATLTAGTALFAAGTATADSSTFTDVAFIAALDLEYIPYVSEKLAVRAGHLVCAMIDDGNSPYAIGKFLYRETDMSVGQAGYFVGASVAAYCPEYDSALT